MKAGDRPTSNGNEDEREESPWDHRPPAVDETGDSGHLNGRGHQDDAGSQQTDDPHLHESREIVARNQEHPDRENGGEKTISGEQPDQRVPIKIKGRAERRFGDPLSADYREKKERHPDDGNFSHMAGAEFLEMKTHVESDRDRHREGKSSPGIMVEGVHHRESQPGQRDDDNEENRNRCGDAGDRPDLIFRNLRERAAVPAHRGDQNDEILNRAGQNRSDHDPEETGKKTELRRQYRSEERPRAGNRRKMMSEEYPAIGRLEIVIVPEPMGRGNPSIVQLHDPFGKEAAVKADRQNIETGGGHHQPKGIDLLPRIENAGHETESDRH